MIRPEAWALLARWHEVALAALGLGVGLWLGLKGGVVPVALGGALMVLAASWGILALRRLRFAAPGASGPGMIEIDEGEIRHFGPEGGGFAPLREITELRLLVRDGRRVWHLRLADGRGLAVPVDASGAAALFDAFAALPGMDSGALVAALEAGTRDALGAVIWRRPGLAPLAASVTQLPPFRH